MDVSLGTCEGDSVKLCLFVWLVGWLISLFVWLVGCLVDWFVLFCSVLFCVFVCSWF